MRVKEGAAEGDEEVGADAGGLGFPLALDANDGAEDAGHEEALDGVVADDDLLEVAEVEGKGEEGGRGCGQVDHVG